jgi:hypothetical protein
MPGIIWATGIISKSFSTEKKKNIAAKHDIMEPHTFDALGNTEAFYYYKVLYIFIE